MPKAEQHFDAHALLTAVQQQDVGLRISTNDPTGFRRILYAAIRSAEHLRCYIYQDPSSRSAFLLLKKRLEEQTPLPEIVDEG